jgi:PEP-CTERM motif-containing protein
MKKSLLPLAIATAISLSSTSANAAFLDFTMDYGSVPDFPTSPFLVDADKLNGGYSEIINLTPTANPLNFDYSTTAFINIGQAFKNEGATQVAPFGSFSEAVAPAGFGMYAVFSSVGTYNNGVFQGISGLFDLYIDPSQDIANTFIPGGDLGLSGTGDDYKIGFASVMDYLIGLPAAVPSAYDTVFSNFTLTTGDQNAATAGTQNGDLFFVDPRPFHLILQSNGDFDQFIPNYNGEASQIYASGDVSAVFKVPEPASLALMGIGLLGLGLSRRKQAQSFTA